LFETVSMYEGVHGSCTEYSGTCRFQHSSDILSTPINGLGK